MGRGQPGSALCVRARRDGHDPAELMEHRGFAVPLCASDWYKCHHGLCSVCATGAPISSKKQPWGQDLVDLPRVPQGVALPQALLGWGSPKVPPCAEPTCSPVLPQSGIGTKRHPAPQPWPCLWNKIGKKTPDSPQNLTKVLAFIRLGTKSL